MKLNGYAPSSSRIVIKRPPEREELMRLLTNPSFFAEALIRPEGAALKLDYWQSQFLNDKSKIVSILKSRRVGGSWIMALKMFVRAMITQGYNATFISMNREEARGKIEYVESFHEALPARWRMKVATKSRDEISFVDKKGRRSTLRSLAGKAPRGRGGDVGISELPHCINARQVYEGALHVTARSENDILTIESTPLGKNDIFYELSSQKFSKVSIHKVPWWFSFALCIDVDRAKNEAPSMTTKERVETFGREALKTIYLSMDEVAFRRESELLFTDVEESVFPVELILNCTEAEFGDVNEKLLCRCLNRMPNKRDLAWLSANRKGRLIAGYDPGGKKDAAAMVVVDVFEEKVETRLVASFHDESFTAQQEVLNRAIRNHKVSQINIDSTGIGAEMAERLESAWPNIANGFHFTAKLKERLVNIASIFFSERKITLPAERHLITDIASIKEAHSTSGNRLYQAKHIGGSHADRAWALMLALLSAKNINPHKEVSYESLSRRDSKGSLI